MGKLFQFQTQREKYKKIFIPTGVENSNSLQTGAYIEEQSGGSGKEFETCFFMGKHFQFQTNAGNTRRILFRQE